MRTVTMRYGQAGERTQSTPTETLLWSRASETGAFTATLSSPASAFDYIRIEVMPMTESNPVFSVYMKQGDFDQTLSTNTGRITLGARGATYYYSRFGAFNSDYTQITWTTSYRAGATNTNASYVMPLRIYGVKV